MNANDSEMFVDKCDDITFFISFDWSGMSVLKFCVSKLCKRAHLHLRLCLCSFRSHAAAT